MSKQPKLGFPAGLNTLLTSYVLDSITIPTFALNTQHEITHWNKALEKITGFLAGDMIGSKDQWKPFYPNPRPTLCDLIIEEADNDVIKQFFAHKYRQSNILENALSAEDFFPTLGNGEWLSFTAGPILDSKGNTLGAVETLSIISEQKQAEKELIRSQQKYRELSTLDDLTQLYNARYFFSTIESEVDRCNRYSQALTACMFDLDDFKIVNDTYGHQFGNIVLSQFATIIKTNIRHVDMAFRYGGEEFIVLFPFVIAHQAAIVVDKILKQLEQTEFKTTSGQFVHITASAGLASYQSQEGQERFIHRTDKAMYQSKAHGKNQITLAD
ncbi:MAG: diguanylate cyclase [Cycloclasticus sp.]